MNYNLNIIAKNDWSGKFLKKQLEDLFGNIFKITCHSPDTNPIVPIYNAEMILLHEPSALIQMQSYIKCDCPILLMRRTITLEALKKLKKIPSNSTAAVVNLNNYMTYETMTNIYQLGVKNIHLTPWSPDANIPFPNIDYIFTPRIYDFLPKTTAPKIILGSRVLTADVIMDILSYFNIEMEIVKKIFKNYIKIVPSFLKGINSLLENNKFLSAQWNLLFNKINKGIAIINTENQIISHNQLFLEYLKPLTQIPTTIYNLGKEIPELKLVLQNNQLNSDIIEIQKTKYAVDLNYLDKQEPKLGKILILEPYNHIQSTQQKLHKKIVGNQNFAKYTFNDIIGKNKNIKKAINLGNRFANSNLPILIYGDSGTGKELMASSIHNASTRSLNPYIAVNCAGIPNNLLESEFFGYEGSSFTGAKQSGSIGLFEKAHGGTLFLDEISEIPYSLQAKLLRAIQEKEIRKVGANYSISIDVRIIAASNKNLFEMVLDNKFRKDLFFRLNVFSLTLPPLKERGSDILLLCNKFLALKKRKATKDFYLFIQKYDWPGNIRELINLIDYMCIVSDNDLDIYNLPDYIKNKNSSKIITDELPQEKINLLVLKSIYLCKKNGESTGRRNLCRFFSNSYYKISEIEMRKILTSLSQKNYLIINKGRSGCQLTDTGLLYLSKSNFIFND
ncbi:sigma 54-interacting transcriptional regulator [Peptostreptococcaceae bacterium AGR-M142]